MSSRVEAAGFLRVVDAREEPEGTRSWIDRLRPGRDGNRFDLPEQGRAKGVEGGGGGGNSGTSVPYLGWVDCFCITRARAHPRFHAVLSRMPCTGERSRPAWVWWAEKHQTPPLFRA